MSRVVRSCACALALLWLALAAQVVSAQSGTFQLRTEPAVPVAGQPFDVVAQSGPCFVLLTGNQTGTFVYGGVSVVGSTISARWGSLNALACDAPVTQVRQTVSPVGAGTYTVQLVLQQFPPSGAGSTNESVAETITIQVASGGQGSVQIPASDLTALLALVGLFVASTWILRRHS